MCNVLMKLPVIYLVQVYFVCLANKYKLCKYNRLVVLIIYVYRTVKYLRDMEYPKSVVGIYVYIIHILVLCINIYR